MANAGTPLRQDETQVPPEQLQPYPQAFQNQSGQTVYYVNTGANYRYLSRLIAEFDDNGVITNLGDSSGAYATDIAGVDRLYPEQITTFAQVKQVADPDIVQIVDGVGAYVNELDGTVYGNTQVFLNGILGDVRTQETNLGNLTADANLWYGEQYGFQIDISFKNGGGISCIL
jgi:2',3'-cyclic-nucleotide 2'-phosphodiesterase (5'-nucleotidase family)